VSKLKVKLPLPKTDGAVGCLIGIVVPALYLMVIAVPLTILALLFQYDIACIFGRDIPWFLDLLGGIMFNGVVLIVAVICVIAQALGYHVPFVGGS
jgi:hypothetical protein